MAGRATEGSTRELPGAVVTPATCAGAFADARLWRHDLNRARNRPGRYATIPGALRDFCFGRKPRWRGKPDRAPGHHDPRDDPAGATHDAWNRRCAGAPFGRRRKY